MTDLATMFIEEGIEKGKQEWRQREKEEVTRNLLALETSVDTIQKVIGLSIEKMNQLQDEVNNK